MAGLLSLERQEDVAVVTLQRPEKRNALSIDLRVELAESFGALGEDEEVGRDRPDRRPARLLLGHRHDAVRRRPRATASGSSRPASPASARSRPARSRRRRRQRPGARRRLRARAALRPADGLRGRQLRLPRAAARDPAQLRRGAHGAARRGRDRADADGPHPRRRRRPRARHRQRGPPAPTS